MATAHTTKTMTDEQKAARWKRLEMIARRIDELDAGRVHVVRIAKDAAGNLLFWQVADEGKAEGLVVASSTAAGSGG